MSRTGSTNAVLPANWPWMMLETPQRSDQWKWKAGTRAHRTPIALLPHAVARIGMSANSRDAAPHLSFRAQLIADCIKEHGASFFDELMDVSGLLCSQVEEALADVSSARSPPIALADCGRCLCHPVSAGLGEMLWTKAAPHGRV